MKAVKVPEDLLENQLIAAVLITMIATRLTEKKITVLEVHQETGIDLEDLRAILALDKIPSLDQYLHLANLAESAFIIKFLDDDRGSETRFKEALDKVYKKMENENSKN